MNSQISGEIISGDRIIERRIINKVLLWIFYWPTDLILIRINKWKESWKINLSFNSVYIILRLIPFVRRHTQWSYLAANLKKNCVHIYHNNRKCQFRMINHVISVAKYSVSVNTLNPVFPKKQFIIIM